ncbi:uncharacterized protein G2W53_042756 [Senna tora]|uniref:Uncharacterized protein n=1 Tax=Senna tora TaxID=362788 RepID=A0A834W048_9FABA|nr:uncharacterized protein G2W53_042756 [Senna tora]
MARKSEEMTGDVWHVGDEFSEKSEG